MQYRKFGNTELLVSEIGYGAWAIGGGSMIGNTAIGWGDADDRVSMEAINAALEEGINFFDTADVYGLGHSEELIGNTVGANKEVIIATKVGNVARNEQFTVDYSKDHIIKACTASLKRLKRDHIDYYQLHSARLANLNDGECIEAMQLLKQQGKIRYWGISLNTFDPAPEADFFINNNYGNGFQLVINILNQLALPVANKAAKKGYGIIARMPLQFGLLTGKFDKDLSFGGTDHRKKRVTRELVENCKMILAPIWQLTEKYGCTKTALALSYILSYDEVSTVIPGIRTPDQARDNTSGLFKLEAADKEMIESMATDDLIPVVDLIRQLG